MSFTLAPGARLDRYEILCSIAQGGMACVWLARQTGKHGFEKLVAIKTILPHYANDVVFQRMFLEEARIASGIQHPNVVQILDLGEERDVLYIVMEWVDGDSLARLLRAVERRGERIPVGILARIMADTCAGLHAAHELADRDGELLGVVHRDVSPQNVLVSMKGQTRLIDFGMARPSGRLMAESSASSLRGKIPYMSPEQALGVPVDRRADIWALGAVAYHVLTGFPPYDDADPSVTIQRLIDGAPLMPIPSWVPRPIAWVFEQALIHDRDSRIATAAEIQQRLEHGLAACRLTTTAADVATYVNEHLGDRADARKQAVTLALEHARERASLDRLRRKPAS